MRREAVCDGEGKGGERKLYPYIPKWEVIESAYAWKIKLAIGENIAYLKLWK